MMVLDLNHRRHKFDRRQAWQVYKIGQARPALKQYPMADIDIFYPLSTATRADIYACNICIQQINRDYAEEKRPRKGNWGSDHKKRGESLRRRKIGHLAGYVPIFCNAISNKKTSKLGIFSTENRLRLKLYSRCLTPPFMGKDVTR